MPNKTVLVTGATGLLGRQVVKAFERAGGWDVVGTGLTRADPAQGTLKVDITDAGAVEKVLESAANRHPDTCASQPEATKALNVTATSLLSHLCTARRIVLLYISTDYVFPGTPGDAPYAPTAPTAPPNIYGATKREGEIALLEATKAHPGLGVVLRVPVLYGSVSAESGNAESAVNVLVDAVWKAQQQRVVMDDWAIRYPTNTEDVGRVARDVVALYVDNLDDETATRQLPPILHFSSEDRYTKYGICELLAADVLGLPLSPSSSTASSSSPSESHEVGMVANKEGNDPASAVQRPYDCHLDTAVLKDLGIDVSTMSFRDWWYVIAQSSSCLFSLFSFLSFLFSLYLNSHLISPHLISHPVLPHHHIHSPHQSHQSQRNEQTNKLTNRPITSPNQTGGANSKPSDDRCPPPQRKPKKSNE
ncbi:MAG: hypothetical protein M1819_002925 [Sarea resinae]|nr:MAG: hypothetical protein M1819_002925 [Sarea resinae]